MNRPRDQLLTGPGLAQDQYGCAGWRNRFHLLQHGFQIAAFAYDFLEVVLSAQLFFEIALFLFELAAELNHPAEAVVDLDAASDLAGRLEKCLGFALWSKTVFVPAADEQSADDFTSSSSEEPSNPN